MKRRQEKKFRINCYCQVLCSSSQVSAATEISLITLKTAPLSFRYVFSSEYSPPNIPQTKLSDMVTLRGQCHEIFELFFICSEDTILELLQYVRIVVDYMYWVFNQLLTTLTMCLRFFNVEVLSCFGHICTIGKIISFQDLIGKKTRSF